MSAPMPNPFDPDSTVNSPRTVDTAGAPSPTFDAPAVTNPDRGYMGHRRTPALGTSVNLAAIDSCQEPVAADEIQSSCCREEVYPRYAPEKLGPVKSEVAIGQQETEAAVIVRTAAVSDNFIGHLIHHASLLRLPRFVPDQDAVWAAMHDENAPRALATDPVWADEAPLFLQNAS